MKLKSLLLCLLFFNILESEAREPAAPKVLRLISFTSRHELKLEVTFDAMPASTAVFQLNIVDDKSGKSLVKRLTLKPSAFLPAEKKLVFTLDHLAPVLWWPSHPNLYQLTFQQQGSKVVSRQRIGFRSFASKQGNLYLNDQPVFLRGIAINPPGRGIPDSIETSRAFAEDYVRFMKSIHVNIIRIPNDDTWYDVCDEQGMMVFGGNYSGLVDNEKPPRNYDKAVAWYKNTAYATIAHHPSLVMLAMTNEVPFTGKVAEEWENFLSYAYDRLKSWDSTRVYIANAGYGYGKSGDICDIHRYWGWYYSSPFTFLHVRNNEDIIPFTKKVQPITFTECVGNYTGPDGRYNLTPNHKNPGSQLNWTGHADAAVQALLADEHQSFTFKQATELFRRLRSVNPELSGVFPFTILFHNWHTITRFTDMDPKAVTRQAKISYQPILLSWECWTPQVYAGSEIHPVVHVVNDDDEFRDLNNAKLVYQLLDESRSILLADTIAIPDVPYYRELSQKLSVKLPSLLPAGNYELSGKLLKGKTIVSENFQKLFISNRQFVSAALRPQQEVLLYDPSGNTATALEKLSLSFQRVTSLANLPSSSLLILGENAAGKEIAGSATALQQFIKSGGRVLCLRQDAELLPHLNLFLGFPLKNIRMNLDTAVYPPPARPSRNGYYVNPERPASVVFDGIDRSLLRVWSDYTNWNERKQGFPSIYPVTDGFVPESKAAMEFLAVYGNYGPALEGIALAEMFMDKGSIMLCGLDLAGRAGLDPVADRMLLNLVGYMGDEKPHERFPLVTGPITWGDYASEKGILTGINSGLLLNSRPVLTGLYSKVPINVTGQGDQIAGNGGGFNTKPGIQYVPMGRRPFGPYTLRGFGNVADPEADTDNIGEGRCWLSLPAGKTIASTLVWNPSPEALSIKVSVNDKNVMQIIKAGERAFVDCLVSDTNIKLNFSGDRRLVILQTVFR